LIGHITSLEKKKCILASTILFKKKKNRSKNERTFFLAWFNM